VQKYGDFTKLPNISTTFFELFSALSPQNTLFCPLAQLLTPTKIFFLFLLDSRRILQNLPFILLF